MTKAFLKQARAQAALTAYRDALAILRKHPTKDAEQLVLAQIAAKKSVVDEWNRKQAKAREESQASAAERDYREANAELIDDDR